MTLGTHDTRRRRSRRVRISLLKWGLALAVILAAGVYAYRYGLTLAEREVVKLKQEIEGMSGTVGALRQENAELEAAVRAAEENVEEWRLRYERDVPTGELKELHTLIQQKLASGVDVPRLASVVGLVQNVSSCDETPVTKRFIVPTPLYNGGNDSVTFADNTITVTAEGQSASDAEGNREAWYDPAKPVTVRFTRLGGETSEVSGKLPLHHSVVVNDSEYRFSMTPGERSFLKVTGDRCRYP